MVFKFAALLALGTVLVWVLLRLDWRELANRFVGADPSGLVAMLFAWIAVLLLRPVRTKYLLRVLGHVDGVDYQNVWTALILGAATNSFVPMRAGDVVFAIFLRQRLGIDLHIIFVVVVADWACDLICVAITFLGALAFAPALSNWTNTAILVLPGLICLGIGGLWALIRWRTTGLAIVDRGLARFAPGWRVRGLEVVKEFLDGLATIGRPKTAIPLFLLTALIWCLTWLSYVFGLRAVVSEAPLASAAFNMAAVALSFVVPAGPGGLGAFEASSVLSLAVFQVPLEGAMAFAVMAHACQLGTILLFTLVAVITGQIDYRWLWANNRKS